jgi:replication factor A1
VDEGACVSIDGVQRKEDEGIVEYLVSDAAVISILPEEIDVPSMDADDVTEGQTSVVTGEVVSVTDIRSFITRRGTESHVRNVRITGSSKKTTVNVALWGDAADVLILPGDAIQVVNAVARLNKYGDIELSVGRGSAMRSMITPGKKCSVSGMVIPRPEGLSLDDGKNVWMIFTEANPVAGAQVQATGTCRSRRIYVETIIELPADVSALNERLSALL